METIGQKLKAAREKSGLSHAEVAKAIRAKTEYIAIIEKDDFHKLIAPVYARGFIKLYAQCVQLDPAPLLRQFSTLADAAAAAAEPARPEIPSRPATPLRRDIPAKKKRPPLKINLTAYAEAWRRIIKSIDLSRLRLPSVPAMEWPDKKWLFLIGALAVGLAVLPVLFKRAMASPPRIKVPAAARWIADPPEPYLELSAPKPQK